MFNTNVQKSPRKLILQVHEQNIFVIVSLLNPSKPKVVLNSIFTYSAWF